ncbi:G-box-binding factor-like [Topomyia yanbarensis]|uniref:G-box-binding factor-like n=1 Tax=Topomyia yanbarensis TaxID=2498891 RepID=UPI00273B29E6|nr:G-box-binding factor-like [Topomyia yanbarensis]
MKASKVIFITLVIVSWVSAEELGSKDKRSIADHGSQLTAYHNHVAHQQQQQHVGYNAPVVQDHYSQHHSEQQWSQPDELLNHAQQHDHHLQQTQPAWEHHGLHTSVHHGQDEGHHYSQYGHQEYQHGSHVQEEPVQQNHIEHQYSQQQDYHGLTHQQGHILNNHVAYQHAQQQNQHGYEHQHQQQVHFPAEVQKHVPLVKAVPYPMHYEKQVPTVVEKPVYKDVNVGYVPKPVAVHIEKPYPVYVPRPVYVEKPVPVRVVILREKNKSWWSKFV